MTAKKLGPKTSSTLQCFNVSYFSGGFVITGRAVRISYVSVAVIKTPLLKQLIKEGVYLDLGSISVRELEQ